MKRTYVAGHLGMVGSALVRELNKKNKRTVITATRNELDLTNQSDVNNFIKQVMPDEIIVAAAKVGGIHANRTYPAEFIYDNLAIATNLIHSAYKNKIKKLLYLGSSCIYPREAIQPINENELLSGPLEKTNEWYAISKIAGIKLCQSFRKQYNCDFISAMPTNLYGIKDNYHLENAHVIPAIMHRAFLAKKNNEQKLTIWGTGNATREFLFVDDLAEGCIFLLNEYSEHSPINLGTGIEVSIKDLAVKICEIVGFNGELVFDTSKPDGTPRKVLDVTKINELGWQSKTNLENGLKISFEWFLNNYNNIRIINYKNLNYKIYFLTSFHD